MSLEGGAEVKQLTDADTHTHIMDSLIVNPQDEHMKWALMCTERMHAAEDMALEAAREINRLRAEVAGLHAEIAKVTAALAAQPRPQAYYITMKVPRGTTREQVEEGLKRVWVEQQLATDGVFRTGFCVVLETSYTIETGAYYATHAWVFVYGARGIMPHQTAAWLTAAVPGSSMHRASDVRAIWQDAEVEYFMSAMFGAATWVMYPGRDDWVKEAMEPLCDEDDECDVQAWMEQTYVHGLPAVPLDGAEHHVYARTPSAPH